MWLALGAVAVVHIVAIVCVRLVLNSQLDEEEKKLRDEEAYRKTIMTAATMSIARDAKELSKW